MSNLYKPKNKQELLDEIDFTIENEGLGANLNHINTSKITDMSGLFKNSKFYGAISKWDVSNVTNMEQMFYGAKGFNRDISKWDVSNVVNTNRMFCYATNFNSDISKWNLKSVKNSDKMFTNSGIEKRARMMFPELKL